MPIRKITHEQDVGSQIVCVCVCVCVCLCVCMYVYINVSFFDQLKEEMDFNYFFLSFRSNPSKKLVVLASSLTRQPHLHIINT